MITHLIYKTFSWGTIWSTLCELCEKYFDKHTNFKVGKNGKIWRKTLIISILTRKRTFHLLHSRFPFLFSIIFTSSSFPLHNGRKSKIKKLFSYSKSRKMKSIFTWKLSFSSFECCCEERRIKKIEILTLLFHPKLGDVFRWRAKWSGENFKVENFLCQLWGCRKK